MVIHAKDAVRVLREAYEAKGYIRVKMDKRQGGRRTGWEIRLRASGPREARNWAQALGALGLEPGTPYARGAATVLPLYGRAQVERFLKQVKPRRKSEIPTLPGGKDMRRSRRAYTGRRRG